MTDLELLQKTYIDLVDCDAILSDKADDQAAYKLVNFCNIIVQRHGKQYGVERDRKGKTQSLDDILQEISKDFKNFSDQLPTLKKI